MTGAQRYLCAQAAVRSNDRVPPATPRTIAFDLEVQRKLVLLLYSDNYLSPKIERDLANGPQNQARRRLVHKLDNN
jgi:hypothetical protein